VVKGSSKLTGTTLVLLTQLPRKGGNIFASVAGWLHERGRYAAKRGEIVKVQMRTELYRRRPRWDTQGP
jgi:hypothetical protein